MMCVVVYLSLATYVFKSDKTELIFDYNRSLVVNLSSEVDSFFDGIGDKMRLIAYFYNSRAHRDSQVAREIIERTPDLVFLAGSDRFSQIDQKLFFDKEFMSVYGVDESYLTREVSEQRAIPFEQIQMQGEAIWNATLPDGPALIGFARTVVEEDSQGVPINQFALIAYVKADRILRSIQEGQFNETYILNEQGEILAHRNPEVMEGLRSLSLDLYEKAHTDVLTTRVLKFDQNEETYLGAYSKALGGKAIILSSVNERHAFQALNRLIYRSGLFASIVMTVAFIVAILFSRSLTRPIETLVGGMQRVSEGDLNTKIRVKTRDEIALLAVSFNRMIEDLKQSRAELEEINRELENKVKDRTRQLEERNVAVKEAQEALLRTTRLAAAGEVAGLAAHEVLNPLTSIIFRINDLKRRLQEERSQEIELLYDIKESWRKDYTEGGLEKLVTDWKNPSSVQTDQSLWDEDLGNIEAISDKLLEEYKAILSDTDFLLSESQRINRIINSFRKLNSVQADIRAHSAHDLINHSIKIMVDLAQKNNIEITYKKETDYEIILVDEDEFIQVMTNLIRNSIQAIQEKGEEENRTEEKGHIEIYSCDDGKRLLIGIKDNGVGISKENQRILFEKPFTTKPSSEGTGIGLSISRRLIRAFKGDIKLVQSTEGLGAEFQVSVPLHAAQEERSSA